MEEIQLKYIEKYVDYFHRPGSIRDTTNVRLIIDLQKLIMQRVLVQRATTFAQLRTQLKSVMKTSSILKIRAG